LGRVGVCIHQMAAAAAAVEAVNKNQMTVASVPAAASAATAAAVAEGKRELEYRVVKGTKINYDKEQLLAMMSGCGWMSLQDIRDAWRQHLDETLDVLGDRAFEMKHRQDQFRLTSQTLADAFNIYIIIPELLSTAVKEGKLERRGPGSDVPVRDVVRTPGAVVFEVYDRPYDVMSDDEEEPKFVMISKTQFDESRDAFAQHRKEVADLKDKADAEKQRTTCTVCLDAAKAIRFEPCGHVCCCAACAKAVDKCPLCRAAITHRQPPFVV
jgi:hypothetical protein